MADAAPRLVIFDLDGVIYRGVEAVAGAADLVDELRRAGLLVRFATNNSLVTRADYAARLAAMGVPAAADEIFTSNAATIEHLRLHAPAVRRVLAVGERGLVEELRGAGYDVTPAAESRTRRGQDGRFDACIVGLDRSFDYPRLTAAMGAILGGARFIATNADRWYPDEHGLLPGAGAMVAAIAAAARRRPRVIGKPAPEMFALILEAAGVRADEALVIGDNPDADILAARRAGIPSVLVLTGVADAAAARRLRADRRPDHVLAGPAAVGELLRELVSRRRPSAPRRRAPRPRAAPAARAERSRGGRR